jgi:hypothetical protein
VTTPADYRARVASLWGGTRTDARPGVIAEDTAALAAAQAVAEGAAGGQAAAADPVAWLGADRRRTLLGRLLGRW